MPRCLECKERFTIPQFISSLKNWRYVCDHCKQQYRVTYPSRLVMMLFVCGGPLYKVYLFQEMNMLLFAALYILFIIAALALAPYYLRIVRIEKKSHRKEV